MNLANVLYFIPTYDQVGHNVTQVAFPNGEQQIINLTIKQCIDKLLTQIGLDRKCLRNWTDKIIQGKHNTPLILTENIIFIPVKMRHADIRADGCIGYVRWDAILKIQDYGLTLKHHFTLTTYSSSAYIKRKLTHSYQLQNAYALYKKRYEFMSMDMGMYPDIDTLLEINDILYEASNKDKAKAKDSFNQDVI